MFKFRRRKVKFFKKKSELEKNAEKTYDKLIGDKGLLPTTVGLVGLGVSLKSLSVNQNRIRQDRDYQEEQAKATKKLTDALLKDAKVRNEESALQAAKYYKKKVEKPRAQEPLLGEIIEDSTGVTLTKKK